MISQEVMPCPLCKSSNVESILNLNCGRFDGSDLYPIVKLNACDMCGHVYNSLNVKEIEELIKYYNEEYAPVNRDATYKTGNMPGGVGDVAFDRYSEVFNLLSPYIRNESMVLDVGCAMGGFLDYLYQEGVKNLFGIDLIDDFVNYANQKGKYRVRAGSADSIPFDDKSFDVLIINQVLEHLADPSKAFKEARRVLKEGGILYLGVPDALRYKEIKTFDFYWFLIRDHIQHFDLEHLRRSAETEGFELLICNHNNLALSKELALPNLNAIFRCSGKESELSITVGCFELRRTLEGYIRDNCNSLKEKRIIINELVESQNPLYLWGIGSEFLYLYENTNLRFCNIIGLIDVNPYKQGNFKVGGLPISAPHILENANDKAQLLITAVAYKNAILRSIKDINYKGQIEDNF